MLQCESPFWVISNSTGEVVAGMLAAGAGAPLNLVVTRLRSERPRQGKPVLASRATGWRHAVRHVAGLIAADLPALSELCRALALAPPAKAAVIVPGAATRDSALLARARYPVERAGGRVIGLAANRLSQAGTGCWRAAGLADAAGFQ